MAILQGVDTKNDDFVALYRDFLTSSRKENKTAHDILRIGKLAAKVDSAFAAMSEVERRGMVLLLVEKEIAPPSWGELLQVFESSKPIKIT